MRHIPRFYCPDTALAAGVTVDLPEVAAHHARVVLRLRDGEEVRLFNPVDGEWRGHGVVTGKRGLAIRLDTCIKQQEALRDVWLVLALLKNKDAFDNALRFAVELGVVRIVLIQTERTQGQKLNPDRLRQQIVDAAQQCGRLSVPDLDLPQPLTKLLAAWPPGRRLAACVEGATAVPVLQNAAAEQPRAVLIGPEGGFTEAEKAALTQGGPNWLTPVSLGPLILRSDTAVAVALARV